MARVKERIIDVDNLLNKLEPEQKEIVQNLRALVRAAVPESVEVIKRGNLTYKLNNKDFVWISYYQGHADLVFAMGASLDSDLLRSRGTEKSENVRIVTIRNFEKTKLELERLLKLAASLSFEH